jgi:dihydrofolate synthase/folylpolyglutamate synthase
MNHQETLKYLEQKGNEVQMMHLGLHRTLEIMKALEDPHKEYPSIHIAGTNGKGSVAAMSESILREAGFKTGLFTSPHLVRVEERIRVNGIQVSPKIFSVLATRVRAAEEQLIKEKVLDRPLTTFEFITCCAFLQFARQKVDIAIMEVGLGGKLDATNIVEPLVSVITGIALDHQNYLGRTIRKIAAEKAGIIKDGIPVISGCSDPEAQSVIYKRSKAAKAPLYELGQDFTIQNISEQGGSHQFDLRTPARLYKKLKLSLAGEHQTRNAALAVLAIESLELFLIKESDIRRGLANARWAGRLDEYRCGRRTLLDGAHNPEAAQLLRKHLQKKKPAEIHLVFGAVRDKNIKDIGAALFPLAKRIYLTPLTNTRTADPAEIAGMHSRYCTRMTIHPDMANALQSAWTECPKTGLVVITGSLYLVGELLPIVQAHATQQRSKTRSRN